MRAGPDGIMRLTTFALSFAFLGAAACTGSVPTNNDPDANNNPDAAPAPLMVTVSGMTYDYFALTPTALPITTLSIEGVTPPVTNTSDSAGLYTFDVPPGSAAYAIATKTAFRPTRNPTVVTGDINMMMDMYAGSIQETANLYNLAGGTVVDMLPDTAVVAAELSRNDGSPLDTATLADIQFVDSQNPPQTVTGITGPYFFDINGQLDPAATTAPIGVTPVRIGILNCPVAPPGI